MAIIKCKMCGGDLTLTPGSNLAVCQYCGSQQTVPTIDDDKKARLYNRANQYRLECEFDKAYNAYESIVNDQPDEAEAYWGMLLSEYGVEYVDDPKTGKKVPTCHRTLTRSVMGNTNYKAACQHADAESRIVYEEEAEVLDALQKRVLNASAKEEPYDVFICYKESNGNGNRTPDSVLAQDIYDALTAKNLRVFFSRISLEDKLGQDYEPCIFAALNSAKVMLMVTTDSDHCNSVWVKNEWKRYLDFMKNDPSKALIPVYKDISPYALPDDFRRFQAQDMGKLGAMQDLVRGVEKLLGKGKRSGKAGMSEDEKKAFAAMSRSQRNVRFLILGFIVFVIGFFAIGVSLTNLDDIRSPFMDWIVLERNGTAIDIDQFFWDHEFVVPAVLTLPFIGMMSWISHGLLSSFSRWVFAAFYFGSCVCLIVLQFMGWTIGPVCWGLVAIFAFLASLGTVLAYGKDKKRMGLHFLSMAAALVLTVLIGLI